MSDDAKCDKCQYDLTGLGVRGQCPECGEPFNMIRRSVRGPRTASHERGEKLKARLRTLILAGATLLVLGIGGYAALGAVNPVRPLASAIVIAIVIAMGTLLSYLAEKNV